MLPSALKRSAGANRSFPTPTKLDARDKTWPYYKAKAPSREWIWLKQELKGENSFYKFSYKDHKGVTETNLPIYIELAPVK